MNDEYKLFSLNKFRSVKENSYNNKNNCLKHKSGWIQKKPHITNPKFDKFDQSYYHAGDEEDIKKYGLLPLRYVYSKELKNNNINKNKNNKIFKLYKKINYQSVLNTFNYMFNKFKKGIFIIIKDNKLITFLPFSNVYYINNWYKYIYFSNNEKKLLETKNYEYIKKDLNKFIIDFQKKYPEQYKYRKIDFNRKKWYANNCIFRNLFPNYEGELNTNIIKDMFETLLKERKIPDVEFFVNDRDFPILKKNLTEPYEHIFNSNNIPIEKIYQKNMCPIFSKSITNEYADILMPTNDDWMLVSNKFFTNDCKNSYRKNVMDGLNKNWKTKKEICIFRGSATGCGITLENNMRLKAADLSIDYPDLLDAGITDWNSRMKKYKNEPIKIINIEQFRFKLVNKINNFEKSNYKYILNIDGNVSAFRLSSELNMNSVLLIVTSDYKLWFSNKLEPFVHYIPIKKDLSDLIEQIQWCKKNDKTCEKIAKNAMNFYNKYICKQGIFDYLEEKLMNINLNKDKNLLNIKFTNKNIAIISCFRDKGNGLRNQERLKFIQLMNVILKPYFNFHIYIIEQSQDKENFNIGKLKNIGFKIASQKKYDNYIFSDIDTIPDYDLIPYFLKKEKYPISLASRGTRYEQKNIIINKPFLGALLGFDKNLFEEVNGYPNNFWGWGGEDDALINRLININKNYICIPKKGSIIDLEEKNNKPISIKNKPLLEIKDQLKYEKLNVDLIKWKNNGLNSLEYKILNEIKINEHTTQIIVDLMKKKDMEKNPFLYPNQTNNYNSLKKKVSNSWKKLKKIYI
jgi:hypothetical protein